MSMRSRRWTHAERFQMAYPMSRYTNVRFGLTRTLPPPRGATWAKWFRERVKTKGGSD